MTAKNRQNWKCRECVEQNMKSETIAQSPYTSVEGSSADVSLSTPQNNITQRKKIVVNVSTDNSFESLSTINDSDMCSPTVESCVLNESSSELRNVNEELNMLKTKNSKLETKLQMNENEIELLESENCTLKKQIENYKIEINKLTIICKSSDKKNITSTRRENLHQTKLDFVQTSLAPPTHTGPEVDKAVSHTQSSPIIEHPRIDRVRVQETIPQQKFVEHTTTCQNELQNDKNNENVKNKICILSTNNRNAILTTAQHFLSERFDICHYLTHGIGIRQLIKDLDRKLMNYTEKDFCIIFIGEGDFKYSQNYSDLVLHIKNTLSNVKHTNIIICTPIFNCGNRSNMYNSRIEAFNKLLCQDIIKFEYAYLLDVNRNLSYDYDMFHRWTGYINKYGLKTVLHDVNEMVNFIENIKTKKNTLTTSNAKQHNQHNSSQVFWSMNAYVYYIKI